MRYVSKGPANALVLLFLVLLVLSASSSHGGQVVTEKERAWAREALAREKALCLGVDFNHRFTPAARTAKRWLEEERLGDLLFVNMALWIGKFQEFDSVYFHVKAIKRVIES